MAAAQYQQRQRSPPPPPLSWPLGASAAAAAGQNRPAATLPPAPPAAVRDFHYYLTCLWYHYHLCGYAWPMPAQYYGGYTGEPKAKSRRLSLEEKPAVVTTLKGKMATSSPGQLGLITFRPHSDTEPVGLSAGARAAAAAAARRTALPLPQTLPRSAPAGAAATGSKRRYCGAPTSTSRASRLPTPEQPLLDPVGSETVKPGETTIHHVLPECLAHVFSFLDVTSRGRAAQVSKGWRDVCYEKSVWRGVEAKLHLKRPNPTLYPSLVRRGIRNVQVLSLRRSLRELVNGVHNLESLNLSGCFNLTDSALEAAFCREVPSLRKLNLSLCKDVSDNSIAKIASHCRNLEDLDLSGCTRVTNSALFCVSHLRRMRELSLRSCRHISDLGLQHLAGAACGRAGLHRLESLSLQDCQKVTDEGLRHVASGLRALRSVNLSFCVSVTDTGLKSLARLPSLEALNLRSCDNISDIGIGFLASGASSSQPSTSASSDFSDDEASPGASASLRRLDASFCANVTDSAARHVASGLQGLRSLSLAGCPVGDEGLARLAGSLAHLEELNVGQCRRLTDAGITALAGANNPCRATLRRVDLYGCAAVTPSAVARVRAMPAMRNLNLQLYSD
jgi:F-box/leucine-rich repeat protein 14